MAFSHDLLNGKFINIEKLNSYDDKVSILKLVHLGIVHMLRNQLLYNLLYAYVFL